jgi:hypothetical protein
LEAESKHEKRAGKVQEKIGQVEKVLGKERRGPVAIRSLSQQRKAVEIDTACAAGLNAKKAIRNRNIS